MTSMNWQEKCWNARRTASRTSSLLLQKTSATEKTGIESRSTILGHVQRGGSPTVRDRVVASEMGYYAVELLEKGASNRVVGMQNNKIVDFDIQEALSMKKPYEEHLHQIAQDIAFF